MLRSSLSSALQTRVAALAREGAAIVVATRDGSLRPSIARAWGVEPVVGQDAIRLCVEAPALSQMRKNLRPRAEIAVTVARPVTYRSAQLKGVVVELGEPTEIDLARVDEHNDAFSLDAEAMGFSPPQAARVIDREALLSVTITVQELFDQTPGATAGAQL